ncbi:glycosyltransferase family 4 protein [Corynebacterium pyruviciproducens]|uniref:Glycosyltransferase family 1 protein n=1 Tax=Corynebacterium pyruviciproducens TaxID=598660 RepID=A0AAF0YY82_9CORY|nr:glycosyltransferase family 1 protein [Corynebacterium pyruviciproducens]WOT03428.1 glycosyltransferase family 1 protein [Corynebacterium pyruviciproducens]
MRIAFFTEVFLPKIDGVVTRLTKTLEELAAMGHECIVVAPQPCPDTFAGFPVIGVPASGLPVYPELKYGWLTPHATRIVTDFNPDIVHVVNPIWLAAGGIGVAKLHRTPLVASFHTNVPDYMSDLGLGWFSGAVQRLIRFLHNRAQANLVTSLPMLERAKQVGITNVTLWPKAVDTRVYDPQRAHAGMRSRLTQSHPDSPLFLFVGRLSKEKNLEFLHGVMQGIRGELPDARLAFVGAGPDEEPLKQLFNQPWCTFTGYMRGEELATAFASADVFLFPSKTETLGLVALEAMASGVPVVGARAGGIPFTIRDGATGYLATPDNTVEWVDKAVTCYRKKEFRAAARAEAERYSWAEATQALTGVYSEVLQHSAKKA